MDFSTVTIGYWILTVLIGALCAYFGYRYGKGKNTSVDNSGNLVLFEKEIAKLQTDLDACKARLSSQIEPPVESVVPVVALVSFDATTAKAVMGKTVKEDDLKIIEGIGPKIEEMFRNAGISTWKSLSETAVAQCQEILREGGSRFKVHDPASWPMQAKMCFEGKWVELARWQDEHDHGKL
ncbi:hypothetical protein [Kriegella aquimaris]|uniref:Predicted 5' DNA nuclease, flap endonuclease-1-like, helix-3-turn-helix (H3TH) domain n=1 Tax=Kriegella aquimaris TaxID=192904 RepID=A0A1G9LS98_9FLAO|nr:hypothetical protein [Kriegella aquimaris]SDL64763.1 Predicted 5' DNA nuclease, flap endonuclease-1-like, helix-3-turn-helix (H3TH) domain [Kriegella aquimaris]